MATVVPIDLNDSDHPSDDLDLTQPFVYIDSGRGYQLENGSLGNSDKRYQALPNTEQYSAAARRQ